MKHIKTPVVALFGCLVDAEDRMKMVANADEDDFKEWAKETAVAINSYDELVAALKVARATIIFRMEHCNDDTQEITCTCDWCSDDAGVVVQIDKALAGAIT
jgi:hypothetical protein